MKKIDARTFIVNGVLYTNMNFDARLLTRTPEAITIHVRGDIHFGVTRKPNKMNPGDHYLVYEDFIKTYGPIYDVIGFSNYFKNAG